MSAFPNVANEYSLHPRLMMLTRSLSSYSDVTSDQSLITFNVYDRAEEENNFLGMVEIKPVLKNEHTVDHWYK